MHTRVAVITGASRGIGAASARRADVAEVVLFVLARPRNHRVLEATLRPMTDASWG